MTNNVSSLADRARAHVARAETRSAQEKARLPQLIADVREALIVLKTSVTTEWGTVKVDETMWITERGECANGPTILCLTRGSRNPDEWALEDVEPPAEHGAGAYLAHGNFRLWPMVAPHKADVIQKAEAEIEKLFEAETRLTNGADQLDL